MKKIFQLFLLAVIVFLNGCMNIDTQILDEIQLSSATGYDLVDEDQYEVTVVYPVYESGGGVKNKTLTTTDNLSKEVRDKLNLKSEKPLVSGKLEVALYSRELAEKGISPILDSLTRDPSVGSNVMIGVADGSTKEILEQQYGETDNGIFLSDLIEQNMEAGVIPKTNLHLFMYGNYAEGLDPIAPIIGLSEDELTLKAIGLFDSDRLVGHVDEKDFSLLRVLMEHKSKRDSFSLEINDHEKVSISSMGTTLNYKVSKPMEMSDITIHLKIKAYIREYIDGGLKKIKKQQIEKAFEKDLKERGDALVKQFQELGIDPLGVGEEVRTRSRNWDVKKWDDLYPAISIHIVPEVNITESGVLE
ncbi:Ger(x)C family spore germination protein [Cytobacillus gottheilii]|uniref:Ger(X)C family spore germination protein n=1 Tax=Cytobacillus gottheilii TaxID=859144 RepID=A0ABX8F654_9BACI|nr:Ger(x)C family spore germination protein [Cytobacillus gottheilii]QVY59931.1 Ger(x)C family spore germination protein [Cytobacillus gottheilii]